MKLAQLFYTDLLESVNITVDPESQHCYTTVGEVITPVCIGGKSLVVPTQTILAAGVKDNMQVFHPLCENTIFGESEVVAALRGYITVKLTTAICDLMGDLITIACDPIRLKKLNSKQAEFFKIIPEANAKTIDVWGKIVRKIDPEEYSRRIINIYLKRGGEFKADKFNRSANVALPFLNDIDSRVVMGIKLTKAQTSTIKSLFDHILPGLRDSWMVGSTDQVAPFTHALLLAFKSVAEHINNVGELFGADNLECYDDIYTDLGWTSDLDKISKMRALIPAMPGNTGEPSVGAQVEQAHMDSAAVPTLPASPYPQEQSAPVVQTQPAAPQNQVVATQPQQPAEQTAVEMTGGNSWADIKKAKAVAAQTAQPVMVQPPQIVQQPTQVQYQPQQPTQVQYQPQPQQPAQVQYQPQQPPVHVVQTQPQPQYQQPVQYQQPPVQVVSAQPQQPPGWNYQDPNQPRQTQVQYQQPQPTGHSAGRMQAAQRQMQPPVQLMPTNIPGVFVTPNGHYVNSAGHPVTIQ